MTTSASGGAKPGMMTYFKPLLVSSVLLTACVPPSNNVGDVPTTTEGTTEGETEEGTSTGSPVDTEGMGTETGAETSADTVSTTTAETGNTGDIEGGCLDDAYDCTSAHEPFECGGRPVCEDLQVNDPTLNEFDEEPFGFLNPEAATCILEGLAAGTVGSYRIEVEPGQQFAITYRLEVLTDGSLVIRTLSLEDKACDGYERRLERQPASYFEACQAETDEAQILQCILGAGNPEACVDPGLVCPA